MSTPGSNSGNDHDSHTARSRYSAELKLLWQEADQPSSRDLHKISVHLTQIHNTNMTVSHTTFSKAVLGDKLPTWRVAKILVMALSGNVAYFQRLWNAAKDEEQAALSRPASQDVAAVVQTASDSTDHVPEPGENRLNTTSGVRGQDFTSWKTKHDWRTAPQVIKLLDAAVKSNIDPTKLLFEIAPDDPSGAVPAVAMVADNDLDRAAEVIAFVAAVNQFKGREILVGTAQLRPHLALELSHILYNRHGFDAMSLLLPAMHACHAALQAAEGGHADSPLADSRRRGRAQLRRREAVDDAAYYVARIYHDGGKEELADTLMAAFAQAGRFVKSSFNEAEPPPWVLRSSDRRVSTPYEAVNRPAWMTDVDGEAMFSAACDVVQELLGDPRYTKVGADLIAQIAKRDYGVASMVFATAVTFRADELPRAGAGSLLRILASTSPAVTSMLMLRSIWESPLELTDLGTLLCMLRREDPELAENLARRMLERSAENLVLILSQADDTAAVADLILALLKKHHGEMIRLLRTWWISNRYVETSWTMPSLETWHTGFGKIVIAMLHADPARAIDCFVAMTSVIPVNSPHNLLQGLDDNRLRERTRNELRKHAGEQWKELRHFV